MICKYCKKEGKKSFVYEQAGSVTAMHFSPYYDEDGNRHSHDRNIENVHYSCSNNHAWKNSRVLGKCWCGWPNVETRNGN